MVHYTLFICTTLYVVVLIRFWVCHEQLPGRRWLLVAGLLWPLLLADEWLRYHQLSELAWLLGLSDFIAPLVMACGYRATKLLVLARPVSQRARLWIPAWITVLLQAATIFIPLEARQGWLDTSPVGQPLSWWPVYMVNMASGFAVLLYGILMTELVQQYHHYLNHQVVDTHRYRIRGLTTAAGLSVGLAFVSILVVTAAAFGFLPLANWQTLNHLVMAGGSIGVLFSLTASHVSSPSPLDYTVLEASEADQHAMRAALAKAERTIIEDKLYKPLGLTLRQFCQAADVDPTMLAVALRVQQQKSFRAWVFHYRFEYAKKVLLRSDIRLSRVTRRLGIDKDQRLCDALARHLQDPDPGRSPQATSTTKAVAE
ncbi:DNA mismatch repair protein [Alteromonas sp. ASW11-19]|uniref:DNA mismatch repair protein n=1 Tax=Alteromonas salexigens TaxID=2982530 RepID=A0ABT2VIP0_9ALTE|nr:DNA mismatch repair protein [Alteromonas salexigens]MCU7553000.1 DNA mismatch repair protein [Alteromonas salexigens]